MIHLCKPAHAYIGSDIHLYVVVGNMKNRKISHAGMDIGLVLGF